MELAFPEFISPIVWNMCENLHYESSVVNRYISKSYTTSKNSIGRGQLWCQLLLVIVTASRLPSREIEKRYELPEVRVIEDKIDLKGNENCFESAGGSSYSSTENQRVAYKLASQEYLGCTRDQPMPGPFPDPPIF